MERAPLALPATVVSSCGSGISWYRSDLGGSCDSVCTGNSLTCTWPGGAAQPASSTGDACIEALALAFDNRPSSPTSQLTCSAKYAGGWIGNPSIHADSATSSSGNSGTCYWQSDAGTDTASFCSATFGSYYRFCPCAQIATPSPPPAAPPAEPPPSKPPAAPPAEPPSSPSQAASRRLTSVLATNSSAASDAANASNLSNTSDPSNTSATSNGTICTNYSTIIVTISIGNTTLQ
eukprot:scaffold8804_cov48-Phaeocystis_antarctica.AAC.1